MQGVPTAPVRPSPVLRLQVDVLLDEYRVRGTCLHSDQAGRLADVLNSAAERFVLREATVYGLGGALMQSTAELSLQKTSIYAAVPLESPEEFSRRRLYRTGLWRPNLARREVSMLLPPYLARGHVHVNPASSGGPFMGLARFFPMTDAVLHLGERRLFHGPIILLNRDHGAAIAQLGMEGADAPKATAEQPPRPRQRGAA